MLNAKTEWKKSALYYAAVEDHEPLVQILIDAGADVNATGRDYSRAPEAALYRGRDAIVQKLLDAGGDDRHVWPA